MPVLLALTPPALRYPRLARMGLGIALTVTGVYALLFLPVTPLALMAVVVYGMGALALAPLLALTALFVQPLLKPYAIHRYVVEADSNTPRAAAALAGLRSFDSAALLRQFCSPHFGRKENGSPLEGAAYWDIPEETAARLHYRVTGKRCVPGGLKLRIGLTTPLHVSASNQVRLGLPRFGCWRRLATDSAAGQLRQVGCARSGGASRLALGLALFALAMSLVSAPRQTKTHQSSKPDWPTQYNGRKLVPEPAPIEVAPFYQDFPGDVGFFRTSEERLVLRRLLEPTRKLHPGEHCYRGSGYRIEHPRQRQLADGLRYGCFWARRGKHSLDVCERIADAQGNHWTDVSSWYWAALLQRSRAPWYSVTVVRQSNPDDFGRE